MSTFFKGKKYRNTENCVDLNMNLTMDLNMNHYDKRYIGETI